MNGFITPSRFERILNLPISMAQTELRRGKTLSIAQVTLEQGQVLEMRALSLHLVRLLTFGEIPEYLNSALGLCSVGLYFGPMISSPISYTKVTTTGATATNPYVRKRVRCPGVYNVLVSNNTSNIDMSICATGAMTIYL